MEDTIVALENYYCEIDDLQNATADLMDVRSGLEQIAASLESIGEGPLDNQTEVFYQHALRANLRTIGLTGKQGTPSLESLKETIKTIIDAIIAAAKKVYEMLVQFFSSVASHIGGMRRKIGQLKDKMKGHSTSRELAVSNQDAGEELHLQAPLVSKLLIGDSIPSLNKLHEVLQDAIRSLIDFQGPHFEDIINHFLGEKMEPEILIRQVGQDIRRFVNDYDISRPGIFKDKTVSDGYISYTAKGLPGNQVYTLSHADIKAGDGEHGLTALTELANSIHIKVHTDSGTAKSDAYPAMQEYPNLETFLDKMDTALGVLGSTHDRFVKDFQRSIKFANDMESRLSSNDKSAMIQVRVFQGMSAISRKVYPPTIMFIAHLVRTCNSAIELAVEIETFHGRTHPTA